jgi:hypothetical protein
MPLCVDRIAGSARSACSKAVRKFSSNEIYIVRLAYMYHFTIVPCGIESPNNDLPLCDNLMKPILASLVSTVLKTPVS